MLSNSFTYTIDNVASRYSAYDTLDAAVAELGVLRNGPTSIIYDTSVEPLAQLVADSKLISGEVSTLRLDKPNKSISRVGELWEFLSGRPPTTIVGVGGGTTLDLVGFAAATYRRGTAFISFPTTFLAMVDASIGGKTGIGIGDEHSAVGARHLPVDVIVISSVLQRIPEAVRYAGISEVIKIAALYDSGLFEELEGGVDHLSTAWVAPLLRRSAEAKARLLESGDAPDVDLLFGHNIGYALEALLHIPHAQAISIGCVAEAQLGAFFGQCSDDVGVRLQRSMGNWGLPGVPRRCASAEEIYNLMALYKLTTHEHADFVIPAEIGERWRDSKGPLMRVGREECVEGLRHIGLGG